LNAAFPTSNTGLQSPHPELVKDPSRVVLKIKLGTGGSRLYILVTWEAEIRRIVVRGQPRQIVCETLSPK
jgi:hypothetical protein